MSRKIEPWQIVFVVVLALAAGVLPLAIGVLLGFGAFVVTPIVMVGVLVGLGGAVARIMPEARWAGVTLATLVLAAAFALVPLLLEWAMNGRLSPMLVAQGLADIALSKSKLVAVAR